jgi:hypothetical protein
MVLPYKLGFCRESLFDESFYPIIASAVHFDLLLFIFKLGDISHPGQAMTLATIALEITSSGSPATRICITCIFSACFHAVQCNIP